MAYAFVDIITETRIGHRMIERMKSTVIGAVSGRNEQVLERLQHSKSRKYCNLSMS
jgi:hypothetical protein